MRCDCKQCKEAREARSPWAILVDVVVFVIIMAGIVLGPHIIYALGRG
jgi:hypothetical protein